MNRTFSPNDYVFLIKAHWKTALSHIAVVAVNGVASYLNALAFFTDGALPNKIMAFANGLVALFFARLVIKSLQRISELKVERDLKEDSD